VEAPKYTGAALHGEVGVGKDGHPLWEPKPVPENDKIQEQVRGVCVCDIVRVGSMSCPIPGVW